jgi:hypothetical protein
MCDSIMAQPIFLGFTSHGDANGKGVIFSFDTAAATIEKRCDFDSGSDNKGAQASSGVFSKTQTGNLMIPLELIRTLSLAPFTS